VFEVVSLLLVFALMVYLLRRKADVSHALMAGAAAVGLIFGVDWPRFPRGLGAALAGVAANFAQAAIAPAGIQLLALILLITFLGHVLEHAESLQQLMGALRGILRDRRAAMAVAPAFIGLLPMPGGALFSAPMVGELTEDLNLPAEERTLINFWFRHVWELTWPLYPGLLIAAVALGVPLERLILVNLPMTLGAIVIGIFLCLRRVKLGATESPGERGNWRELAAAVWPVALLVVLTAALATAEKLGLRLALSTDTALLVALIVVIPSFVVLRRIPWREAARLARATLSLRLVLLIYGIVAFGRLLRVYGAAADLPRELAAWGVPGPVLLFVVPMAVGLLTGYTPAFVGICFPVLRPLMVAAGGFHYGYITFAFAGGFLGVLLSPVHLCLVLSAEYFKADFGRVYRRLAVPAGLLALVALGTLFLWEAVALR